LIQSDFVKSLLALLAWREERSNHVNGMLGVCFVVRNRVKAGWNGGDYLKNITAHNQFSSISVIGDGGTVAYPVSNDPEFMQILQLVDLVYDDTRPDTITNGALYYADMNSPGYNHGGWFDRNIVQNPTAHPRCAQIGSTTYFK
jgi:hypothetical protein